MMRRLTKDLAGLWITMGELILLTVCWSTLTLAQGTRDPALAMTLDATVGQRAGATTRGITNGIGVMIRVMSSDRRSVSATAGYSVVSPLPHGATGCMETYPCGSIDLQNEWRLGAALRQGIGASAYFVQIGGGVTWPHHTGAVVQSYPNGKSGVGGSSAPLGLGQIGVGLRSKRSRLGRWVELGLEKDAAARSAAGYVRFGFGLQ